MILSHEASSSFLSFFWFKINKYFFLTYPFSKWNSGWVNKGKYRLLHIPPRVQVWIGCNHPQKGKVHPDRQQRIRKSRQRRRPLWKLGIRISHPSGFLWWRHPWINAQHHPKAMQSRTSRDTQPVRNFWRVWDRFQRKVGIGLRWILLHNVKRLSLGSSISPPMACWAISMKNALPSPSAKRKKSSQRQTSCGTLMMNLQPTS